MLRFSNRQLTNILLAQAVLTSCQSDAPRRRRPAGHSKPNTGGIAMPSAPPAARRARRSVGRSGVCCRVVERTRFDESRCFAAAT
jgi:hypothetical protein